MLHTHVNVDFMTVKIGAAVARTLAVPWCEGCRMFHARTVACF